jgi:1-deoxy-D-xylulose-5-phosphate reductoisomerase
VAVESFLRGRICFPEIARVVEQALQGSSFGSPQSIGDVLEIDQITRTRVTASMTEICH